MQIRLLKNMKIKNWLLIVGTLFLINLISGCSTQLKQPKIELSTTYFDLGDINPDEGKRSETFFVENKGTDILKILSVSTSCGCTEAEVENEEIQPGEKTKLTVTYDPSIHPGLVGNIKRVVYIQSNDPLQSEIELELVGNSLPSSATTNEHQTDEHHDELKDFEISPLDVYSKIQKKENIKLVDVREDNEYEESHLKDTLLLSVNKINKEELEKLGLQKDNEIIVYCRSGRRSATAYEELKKLGYTNIKSMAGGIVHWLEEGYPVELGKKSDSPITSYSNKPIISIDPIEYDFGKITKAGGIVTTTFEIKNIGNFELKIEPLSTSCGCTTAEIDSTSLQPGESTTLTVFFNPNYHKEPEGRFSRTVFIESNDPVNPESEVKIFIDIEDAK